jgi:hypothetical protein
VAASWSGAPQNEQPMPVAHPWPDLKNEILDLLAENRFMAVATIRPDGWPQATIVGYANLDLQLYFAVGDDSQKLANITPSVVIPGEAAGRAPPRPCQILPSE